jgi:hypothetical protein
LVALSATAQEPADVKGELKTIREALTRLDQRLDDQKTHDLLVQRLLKDVNDLRDEIARLQRDLADVRNRAAGTPSTSNFRGSPSTSMSVGPPVPTASMPTATIRLVNTHMIEMTAVINGTLVTVPPGTERIVTVPAGPVNYQVYQVPEPMKTRILVPNETLTLTLFPR